MRESGTNKPTREMDAAIKFGLTAPSMKVTGAMIRPTARADSFMLMETCMKASGRTIRLMATADICTQMVLNMKGSGKKTSSTERVRKLGQTVLATKEIT